MRPTQFSVSELLDATHGELLRGQTSSGVTGISTDTRTLTAGEAYVALRGPRFDGHQFLREACARGAAALLVEQATNGHLSELNGTPLIGVADTVQAYGALARWHRRRFRLPVIAITGSCGKTTTKEYVRVLLEAHGSILTNHKTENNAIGVPRTLLQLTSQHTAAVVELGSNHPGEIAILRDMVEPTHAIVTTIGPAHLAFFQSVAAVAAEKLSLLDAMPSSGGIVLNADDPWMRQWAERHHVLGGLRLTTFGMGPHADVWASALQCTHEGMRFLVQGRHAAHVPTWGTHHVLDALAAIACAEQLGSAVETLLPRLAHCPLLELRMERRQLPGGPTLLCDCYNANPLSMAQAIQALAQYPAGRRRILIAGEMRELGSFATEAHCHVGQWAMQAQLDGVIAIGPYAALVLAGAQTVVKRSALLMAYQTVEEASQRVPELLRAEDVILIKGSRGAQLERLIASCQARWHDHAVLAESV